MVTLRKGFVPLYKVTLKIRFERVPLIENFAILYVMLKVGKLGLEILSEEGNALNDEIFRKLELF